MDVKNTVEVLDALTLACKKLKEVSADGKVSIVEGVQLAVSLVGPLVAAAKDAHMVVPEMKDADQAELVVVAGKAGELVKAILALVGQPV